MPEKGIEELSRCLVVSAPVGAGSEVIQGFRIVSFGSEYAFELGLRFT